MYDGACGSGGMFVQSMRFVDAHGGNRLGVSIYGQELTDTTRPELQLAGDPSALSDSSVHKPAVESAAVPSR